MAGDDGGKPVFPAVSRRFPPFPQCGQNGDSLRQTRGKFNADIRLTRIFV
ncbi:MAG: hypothetical protein LBL31_05865 [Spirochaetaceae bacterium]|jgi:hypothetical protein|nr:hypothetical protein [Spirochaetaceae bacterium]